MRREGYHLSRECGAIVLPKETRSNDKSKHKSCLQACSLYVGFNVGWFVEFVT